MCLVGQLAWVAMDSPPEVAFDVGDLEQHFNVATVTELVRANTVLRQAKKLVVTNVLKLVSINLDQATVISVMDASLAGQPKTSSQMCLAVLMSMDKILEGSNTANMIKWHSETIHRVVQSTFAAEAAAMSSGSEKTFFAREVFTETCRTKNPDIPRAGRVGAPGGAAARGRARLSANRTIRQGNKGPPYLPKHRRNDALTFLQKHEQAKSYVNRRRSKISG